MIAFNREPLLLEFYFMRHPESEDNVLQKANGSSHDSGITEQGQRDADLASVFLMQVSPRLSSIHHSRMSRTFDAASRVNQDKSLELVENPAFDEQMLGDWEGVDWDQAAELFLSGEDPPNGETYAEFHARIVDGLQQLAAKEPDDGKVPLVVSHGGVWMALHKICGSEPNDWPENCDIYKVQITGDWDAPRLESELVFRLPPAHEHAMSVE